MQRSRDQNRCTGTTDSSMAQLTAWHLGGHGECRVASKAKYIEFDTIAVADVAFCKASEVPYAAGNMKELMGIPRNCSREVVAVLENGESVGAAEDDVCTSIKDRTGEIASVVLRIRMKTLPRCCSTLNWFLC